MSVQKIYSILRRTVTLSVLPRTIAMATGAALISVGCLMPEDSHAAVITSTAQGDENPAIINGESLQNGDFLIKFNHFKTLGDGQDEFTNWNFDFNSDPNLQAFINAIAQEPLTSANLTLTLSPQPGFSTDGTGLTGVKHLRNLTNVPGIPGVGETGTVVLDLLNDYGFTSTEILGAFNSGDANVIPWNYAEDAIISFAQLELEAEAQSVPEPLTMLGSATALGFGALFKRQHSRKQKKS